MIKYFLGSFLLFVSFSFSFDVLNEINIHPIPEEMTFEEYTDMNRRLTVGLVLSAVPYPGIIHSYAGESKKAKQIRWAVAGGFLSMIGGAALTKEVGWADSKYQTTDINDIRYEMIPIEQEGELGEEGEGNPIITYKLSELEKSYEGGGGLIILGAGIIIASYLYDFIHGITIIEEKRDKVRFKYGKMKNFSFSPTYDMNSQTAGINFSYNID